MDQNNKKLIIIFLVLGIAGVAAYLLFFKDKDKDKDNESYLNKNSPDISGNGSIASFLRDNLTQNQLRLWMDLWYWAADSGEYTGSAAKIPEMTLYWTFWGDEPEAVRNEPLYYRIKQRLNEVSRSTLESAMALY